MWAYCFVWVLLLLWLHACCFTLHFHSNTHCCKLKPTYKYRSHFASDGNAWFLYCIHLFYNLLAFFIGFSECDILCYGHKSSTGTVRRLFHTKIVYFYEARMAAERIVRFFYHCFRHPLGTYTDAGRRPYDMWPRNIFFKSSGARAIIKFAGD